MGRMKEIDIAVKENESLEDAKNRVLQSRKNYNAPKQSNAPFLIDLTPNRRWIITHTDIDGKVTVIADKIPSRNLAEKALNWFTEGKYRRYKMSWVKDPDEKQASLFIPPIWFRNPVNPSKARTRKFMDNSASLHDSKGKQKRLGMREFVLNVLLGGVFRRITSFFDGILGRG